MLKLTMTINGKEINNHDDIKDAVNQIAANGVENVIREKLSSLSSQMDAENVSIKVDMDNGKIEIDNCSDDLKGKIMKILS